mmetsp:Transcript_37045/g.124124  ORF Transcript_37045/g.124124 Transcript_37045/m.124124 type:complete len:371 (-) Transcript_37045:226-1338(-)
MPGEGSSAADANRGCVTMTQRDAEELNQELSKAALRGGDTYIFVPINTPGAMKPAFRSKTPSLVTNSQGGAPSGARSSGGVRRRDSGEPRERKRSGVPGGSAMAAQAGGGGQPVGAVHRSKRPKLAARPGGMSPKLKPVLKLLNELLRHQYVGPFAAPVDPRIYPSYYEGPRAVADPIDLGSIKKNLEAGAYADADAVKTDVDRVWANCRQYNGEESEIARMAETLEEIFDEKMATIPQELEAEEEASRRRDDQRKDKRERDLLKQMQDMQRQMMEMQKQQLAMQQQGMAAVPPGGGGGGGGGGERQRRPPCCGCRRLAIAALASPSRAVDKAAPGAAALLAAAGDAVRAVRLHDGGAQVCGGGGGAARR